MLVTLWCFLMEFGVSDIDFIAFLERHEDLKPVAEDNDAMTGSNVMLDARGRFIRTRRGGTSTGNPARCWRKGRAGGRRLGSGEVQATRWSGRLGAVGLLAADLRHTAGPQ